MGIFSLQTILRSVLPAILLGLSCLQTAIAINPENVLVLYNADDGAAGDGFQIASYYEQQRPGVHLAPLIGINDILTGSTNEEVSAEDYLDPDSGIRRQVLDWISVIPDQIDVIVTTKGLPLRINNSTGHAFSSLESELTRIDSISTVAEMGNLSSSNGYNPYFGITGFPFSHALFNTRLTSRLDARTVQDVRDSIDRANDVYIVPQGQYLVVDDDPSAGTDEMTTIPGQSGFGPGPGLVGVYDSEENLITPGVVELHGQKFVYNNDDSAITTAPGQVLGYVSHGIQDGGGGLQDGYIQNELQFDLADGAVFSSLESFNARSFDSAYTQNQGLLADWLAIGGTAAVGQVEEPNNSFVNITNEDLLYHNLLPADGAAPGESGLTFVEAAWGATNRLSYVNTVIGDPLMRWKVWTPGDANLDGVVNPNDAGALIQNWGQSGLTFADGNFNGDGIIDAADATAMFSNWTVSAPSFFAPAVVPEPGSLLMAVLGALVSIAARRRCFSG